MSNTNETTKAISPETIAEEIIGSLFCIVGFSITRLIAEKNWWCSFTLFINMFYHLLFRFLIVYVPSHEH